ncbi:MAG: MarR family winged helix-turn-helix transcriptional regulator [Veillonellaceae bacterium]|nr:MarR family winged helix-turn-helix transcriptional regulator [Veillonellaceae bacterium]
MDCYCSSARHTAQLLTMFFDDRLRPAGLSISQFYLLTTLQKERKANITAWAEAARLERSTMVRNVRHLRENGWLELTEGTGKTYQLSEKGEEAVACAQPVWDKIQEDVEKILGAEDAKALIRIQKKLSDALRKE